MVVAEPSLVQSVHSSLGWRPGKRGVYRGAQGQVSLAAQKVRLIFAWYKRPYPWLALLL